MGIGDPICMDHCPGYITGASLYMWREFFPNAQIYGADINPKTIFQDERIKTFLCDGTKKDGLERLIENTGSDIDLFIDDGNHYAHNQAFLCKNLMPLFKKDVIYVIEDLLAMSRIKRMLHEFDLEFPKFVLENQHCKERHYRDNLVIVKNNKQ